MVNGRLISIDNATINNHLSNLLSKWRVDILWWPPMVKKWSPKATHNSKTQAMKTALKFHGFILQNIKVGCILAMLPNDIENQPLPQHLRLYVDKNALMAWKERSFNKTLHIFNHDNKLS